MRTEEREQGRPEGDKRTEKGERKEKASRDNNDDINLEKDDINIDKNINYTEINDSAKIKKRNSDGYKEEDIVSKIAITEFSADKNDTFDTFSIRENSNLNIINDDVLK